MVLINIGIGGQFFFSAIYCFKKRKEAKAEFFITEDTGYRTLARMHLFLGVMFSMVVINNGVLIFSYYLS